ncbi:hypothetical protein TNCV_4288541 [Trichonephila clavipes]|nr:hypothetical protein TNCV_4288541 [Trichonephila clavipes]
MNEQRICTKIFLEKPMENRPRGRLKFQWTDCVEKGLNILKVKNWKTAAKSKDAWRRPGPTRGCKAIEEEVILESSAVRHAKKDKMHSFLNTRAKTKELSFLPPSHSKANTVQHRNPPRR